MISGITIPVNKPEFLTALAFGLAALFGAVGWRRYHRREGPLRVVGLLVGVAAAATLATQGGIAVVITSGSVALPPGLILGLAALAGAGLTLDHTGGARGVPNPLLALPGALVIAIWAGLVAVWWIRLLVLAAIVIGGSLLADFDRRWRHSGLGPVLLAVSATGVFYTVPDPEEAMVLLGVTLPIALLGWPVPLASLGREGAFVVTGLFAWTVAAGGYGRHSSIIGGLACLGLFVAEPLARLLTGREQREGAKLTWWKVVAVAVVHLGLVYFASRVAGLQETGRAAAAISVAELALATVALMYVHVRRLTDR